jgi:hypothetical protein
VARDIRMSGEVAGVVGRELSDSMRAGPEPGRYECAVCNGPGDADSEATSIVVHRYPQYLNVVYAHASCAAPAVVQREGGDLSALYRAHVTPLLITDPDGGGWPVLVIEPLNPAHVISPGAAGLRNLHVSTWLSEGLALMGLPPDIPPPEADGWRVVLMPDDADGNRARVTVHCRLGSPSGPVVIADDAPIRPTGSWINEARERQQVIIYAGDTSLRRIERKTAENVVMAVTEAAYKGLLAGGLAQAAIIG